MKFKRIIIVAYRLPFKIIRKKEEMSVVQNAGGLVSAILSLSEKMNKDPENKSPILWVGTGDPDLGREELNTGFGLYPVEIPRKMNDKYYGGFSNDTIWPLFHYFPTRTVYDPSTFEAYKAANRLFLNKVVEIARPGDFIWVHDYQLFLLPDMIRESLPTADIGFFLHIPFPSFEIFRLMPRRWREAILQGITGSDVIGFHTNDYTQHFLKSVKRTLGYAIDHNVISCRGRICKADSFPIGIDYQKFNRACTEPKVRSRTKRILKLLDNKKLVLSLGRLDYSKGFLYKLAAIERFLEKYPEWQFKVVFNIVVVPSRETIEGYRDIKREIEAVAGRINGKYSTLNWNPVIYQYKSLSFNDLIAIYNISDAALIIPLRDGMNLIAKEYVACQNGHNGMLIISEMAGAASELNEAIIVNPADSEETADAIDLALRMPEDEKQRKLARMQERLSRYDVFTWTYDFLGQAEDIKKEQGKMKVKYLDNNISDCIKSNYQSANQRLLLLDYDGTLTPITGLPRDALLQPEIKSVLVRISENKDNTLVIISGRTRDFIEEQFRDIRSILVAEHGFFIKYPGEEWKMNLTVDMSWKDQVLPILNRYVDRCVGSMIENKYASLAWHYRNADEEIAFIRLNELKEDMRDVLAREPRLHLLEGNKVVEIKNIVYDKGTIAAQIINSRKFDFILAVGDDTTDEDLFGAIPAKGFTIKVGCSPSRARFNLKDQSEITGLLSMFINQG